MATFAITGMGRSGTAFLAGVLNGADGWTVEHEPVSGFRSVREAQARFARAGGNYGEVNSYLRFGILALKVDARAVIVRDPVEIFRSMFARGRPRLAHLGEALHALDAAIRAGVPAISFARMTSNAEYLRRVARSVGVELVGAVDMTARNVSAARELPKDMREAAERQTAWFVREHGGRL